MSHFSTVKTQIRKRESLLQALLDLGCISQEEDLFVRGYRGQKVEAEMAFTLPKGANIGFRLNKENDTYELVTDLDLWKESVPVERFLAQMTQRYALHTVLTASANEGFEVAQQSQNDDGSIELVVTRWDP